MLDQFQSLKSVEIKILDEAELQEAIKALSESNLDKIHLFTFDLNNYRGMLKPLEDIKANGIKFHKNAKVRLFLASYKGADLSLLANFNNLEELVVKGSNITNDSLKMICENNKSLKKINLLGCKALTVFSPLAELTNLEELIVADTSITDEDLKKICEQNKSLKKINLDECQLLTDFSPLALLRNLEVLTAARTNITEEDKEHIREMNKRVSLPTYRIYHS